MLRPSHEIPESPPLSELERELEDAKSERAVLAAIWPHKRDVRERHAIGVQVREAEKRIAELQRAIARAEARTPADEAVKLRCLQAVSPQCRCGQELVDTALLAVESLVVTAS